MTQLEFDSYEVVNYKSIKSSGKLEFPGITLIIGPNSSGKSNILESLRLLKQSLRADVFKLQLNGPEVKLGEFRDIVHKKNTDRNIKFQFNFTRIPQNADDPYVCPICYEDYQLEGWYERHFKREHPDFWRVGQLDLDRFEEFDERDPSVEISYSYDESAKENKFDYVEFTNPPPQAGLFASRLRLSNEGKKLGFSIYDIEEEEIISIRLPKSNLQEATQLHPNNISGIFNKAMRGISPVSSETQLRRIFNFYIHEGKDGLYPYIRRRKETINQVLNSVLNENQDIEKEFTSDELMLARGLFSRIASVAMAASSQIGLVDSIVANISHIGPLRESPQRLYFGSGGSPQEGLPSGSSTAEDIFRDKQTDQQSLLNRTNGWLEKTGFDVQLEVAEVELGDLYQLQVVEEDLEVNLADAGFGLSQTLPIIVQSIQSTIEKEKSEDPNRSRPNFQFQPYKTASPNYYLTLIEQPEIHLNPRIEADLADLFIEIAKSNIHLLIETHSEHILNRIQRRVVEGEIEEPDLLKIYFIEKEDMTSQINEINLSAEGVFDNWPDGFFQDDFDEAVKIMRAGLKDTEEGS